MTSNAGGTTSAQAVAVFGSKNAATPSPRISHTATSSTVSTKPWRSPLAQPRADAFGHHRCGRAAPPRCATAGDARDALDHVAEAHVEPRLNRAEEPSVAVGQEIVASTKVELVVGVPPDGQSR